MSKRPRKSPVPHKVKPKDRRYHSDTRREGYDRGHGKPTPSQQGGSVHKHLSEKVVYGGKTVTRGKMIADLEAIAKKRFPNQPRLQKRVVDRYLQGHELRERKLNAQGVKKKKERRDSRSAWASGYETREGVTKTRWAWFIDDHIDPKMVYVAVTPEWRIAHNWTDVIYVDNPMGKAFEERLREEGKTGAGEYKVIMVDHRTGFSFERFVRATNPQEAFKLAKKAVEKENKKVKIMDGFTERVKSFESDPKPKVMKKGAEDELKSPPKSLQDLAKGRVWFSKDEDGHWSPPPLFYPEGSVTGFDLTDVSNKTKWTNFKKKHGFKKVATRPNPSGERNKAVIYANDKGLIMVVGHEIFWSRKEMKKRNMDPDMGSVDLGSMRFEAPKGSADKLKAVLKDFRGRRPLTFAQEDGGKTDYMGDDVGGIVGYVKEETPHNADFI